MNVKPFLKRAWTAAVAVMMAAGIMAFIPYAKENSAAAEGVAAKVTVRMPESFATSKNSAVGMLLSPYAHIAGKPRDVLKKGAKLVYDVYSECGAAGVGGIDMQFQSSWDFVSRYANNMRDAKGLPFNPGADISSELNNGWYRREFTFPETVTGDGEVVIKNFYHYAFTFFITDTSVSEVTVYYRNMHIVNGDGERFSIVDNGFLSTGAWDLNVNDAEIYIKPPEVSGKTMLKPAGWSIETVADPLPATIGKGEGDMLITADRAVDLTTYFSIADNAAIPAGKLETTLYDDAGNKVDVADMKFYTYSYKEGADNYGKVIEFRLAVKVTDADENISRYALKVTVIPRLKVYIYRGDIEDINISGVAGEPLVLPKIKAYYNSNKALAATLTATYTGKDGKAKSATVTEGDDGFTIPTESKFATVFTLTYAAENLFDSDSTSFTVNVVDRDVPVFDLSVLPTYLRIGERYILPAIKAADISDGPIEPELKVTDFDGRELAQTGGFIVPKISGPVRFSYTATDSDGNKTLAEQQVNVLQEKGLTFRMRAYIPEAARVAGTKKQLTTTLYNLIAQRHNFREGDKLVYEVYSPTPMAGIGCLDGQFYGATATTGWDVFSEKVYRATDVDQNGVGMGATADLSDKLTDAETGKPVWYKREFDIPSHFRGKGEVAHFALTMETTAACGEYIDVYYRNAYVLSVDGSVYTIIDGNNHQGVNITPNQPAWKSSNVSSWNLLAVVDPYPVIRDDFLPSKVEFGQKITLPSLVMYDYDDEKFLTHTLTVKDPNGEAVIVSGDSFTANILGDYELNYTATDSDGNTTNQIYVVRCQDKTGPVIKVGGFGNMKKGQSFKMPEITITDNMTPAGDINVRTFIYDPEGQLVQLQNNAFTPQLAGVYAINITATDGNNNRSIYTFEITATGSGGGCNGSAAASVSASVTVAVTAVCAVLIAAVKRNRRGNI